MQHAIGIELAHLKSFNRLFGFAGGKKKKAAILAALREGWIDVLITERRTGEALLSLLLIEPVMRRNLYWE
jgi:DNA-binding transcriptional regulator LsrR (DeoR family)